MKNLINLKTLIVVMFLEMQILTLSVIFLKYDYDKKDNSIERIKQENILKEYKTQKEVKIINSELEKIKNSNTLLSKQINKTDANYRKIVFKIKLLNNEKLKKDNKILNASDSSNRNWFYRRFPKHNKQLSDTANKITGKPSKNRQPKSH